MKLACMTAGLTQRQQGVLISRDVDQSDCCDCS